MPAAGAGADDVSSSTKTELVSVFEEVLKLASSGEDGAAAGLQISRLTDKDVQEIRTLRNPPSVVRRTLEAVFLLMSASKASSASSTLTPPTWQRVQKMLCDTSFLPRMRDYDANALRTKPALASYIATEYFCPPKGGPPSSPSKRGSIAGIGLRPSAVQRWDTIRRSGSSLLAAGRQIAELEEPLTYQRVRRASVAAGSLFGWCTATLMEALDLEVCKEKSVDEDGEEEELPATPPPQTIVPEARACFDAGPLEEDEQEPRGPVPRPNLPPQRPTMPVREVKPFIRAAPPPAPKIVLAQAKPDRHFEALVPFELGHAGLIDESEITLQDVCAMKCMRPGLDVELVGCPARIENDALAEARVQAVMSFFQTHGIIPERSAERTRVVEISDTPGVMCQLVLNRDRELRDFFLLREMGEPFKPNAATRNVIDDLEREYKTCRHAPEAQP